MIQRNPLTLQPKQAELLEAILDRRRSAATIIGYGGSRGCAKSEAVRRCALILTEQPGVIVWIIRRVWDDLNKDHVLPLFAQFPELAQWYRAQNRELRRPNGSSIFFIHAGDSGRSKRKARGPQAHYIFLEQAEEFSQEEMEQLAGSNRAAGVAPGYCKRIFTFNPGGIGTAYLRRVFWVKDYHDNEDRAAFHFIQGFGWDNFEWFRGLGTVSEHDFYNSPEWDSDRRYQVFIEQTDFGKSLNRLPQAQRIGELMGSFEHFSGQYYADVWEPSCTVLAADLVARIVQPWWRRWLATDWGFSHYSATGWFASGLLGADESAAYFGVRVAAPVRVLVMYRELVCNDVAEPDLARLIVSMTPQGERKEVREHYIGHDAWAKRGSANTVVEQMEPILCREGLQRLQHADIDRVGGWRLLYNAWASARKFRKWPAGEVFTEAKEDVPMFFVSAACPETVQAIPMLMCKNEDPTDVEKMAGEASDDIADMVRYGLKSYLRANPGVPDSVLAAETWERYQDPTQRAMAMRRLEMKQKEKAYIHRRRRL
jgi:phage terminase large subunit